MKTPTVPSSAGSVVTAMWELRSEIRRSRWSSRSLGSWPVPLGLGDQPVHVGDLVGQLVDDHDVGFEVAHHAGLHLVQLRAGAGEAGRQLGRTAQGHLAGRGSLGRLVTSTMALRNWLAE